MKTPKSYFDGSETLPTYDMTCQDRAGNDLRPGDKVDMKVGKTWFRGTIRVSRSWMVGDPATKIMALVWVDDEDGAIFNLAEKMCRLVK